MEILITGFFFWIIASMVVGFVASARERSGFGWFLLSLLLSPLLAIILVVALPNRRAERLARERDEALRKQLAEQQAGGDQIADATHTRCPACKEWVRRDAVVCKHCRGELVPSPLPPPPAPQAAPVKAGGLDVDKIKGILIAVAAILLIFAFMAMNR